MARLTRATSSGPIYRLFRENILTDPTGERVFTAVVGKTPAEVTPDWLAWIARPRGRAPVTSTSSAAVATRRTAAGPSPLEAALTDQLCWTRPTYKFAFRKTRHEEEAEDLAQNTAWTAAPRARRDRDRLAGRPTARLSCSSAASSTAISSNQRRTGKRRPRLGRADAGRA